MRLKYIFFYSRLRGDYIPVLSISHLQAELLQNSVREKPNWPEYIGETIEVFGSVMTIHSTSKFLLNNACGYQLLIR